MLLPTRGRRGIDEIQHLIGAGGMGEVYAVPVTLRPAFDYGPPRFLVNMALDASAPPINVVRHWTAGVKD